MSKAAYKKKQKEEEQARKAQVDTSVSK
jgi:hypothetical protein